MKTISILKKTDKGQKQFLLKFTVVGEAWFDNDLFLIIDPEISDFMYGCDLNQVFEDNTYYKVFGKIHLKDRHCLVVKPKKTLKNAVASPKEVLSERELQIVELVAHGKSNKQIAKKLKISEWTVSTHLRRVFSKLNVDSRAAMVYHCAPLVRDRIEQTKQNLYLLTE